MEGISREDLFFVSSVLFDQGSPDQAIKYVLRAIELSPVLTEEEQNVFFAAYRGFAKRLRDSIRKITQLAIYGVETETKADALEIAKGDLAAQLIGLSEEICGVISEQILPHADSQVDRSVYHLVMGDFSRFVAELAIPESESAAAESLKNYTLAQETIDGVLPLYDPVNLTIVLNMTNLMNDVLGQPEPAIELAQNTYNSTIGSVGSLDEPRQTTARAILQSLKDNAIEWATAGF
jgi:hypothetical protein